VKTRSWEDNAHEFKALSKQGYDVRLGVLVACSVGKGAGQTTAVRFAAKAGCSTHTVARYQKAWDKMVQAGWDLPRDKMAPAMAELEDLIPEQFVIEWDALPKGGHVSVADELGISPGAAAIVNSSAANLKAAVLASPKIAAAAEEALVQRWQQEGRAPRHRSDSVPAEKPSYWYLSEAHAALYEFVRSEPTRDLLSMDKVQGLRFGMHALLALLDQAEAGETMLNADEALAAWSAEVDS